MYLHMDYGFSFIIESFLFHMMTSHGSENKQ